MVSAFSAIVKNASLTTGRTLPLPYITLFRYLAFTGGLGTYLELLL
jgi:hypothetical protein